jgi:hypothetical protein
MQIAAIQCFHISVPYDFGNTAANAAANTPFPLSKLARSR